MPYHISPYKSTAERRPRLDDQKEMSQISHIDNVRQMDKQPQNRFILIIHNVSA